MKVKATKKQRLMWTKVSFDLGIRMDAIDAVVEVVGPLSWSGSEIIFF